MINDLVLNKEIIYIIETIAQEKNLNVDSIIEAVEYGIKIASKRKYGKDLAMSCKLDRRTGAISLYIDLDIVDDNITDEFDSKRQITLENAKNYVKDGKATIEGEVEIGNHVSVQLPNMDLGRLAIQIAKNEIFRKIKDAEREMEYNEFINRVGTIVNGSVKKVGIKNVVVDVDGFETLLGGNDIIPNERLKAGDRVRAYIKDVKKEQKGAQVFLSRTDSMFLAELFKQEVPEIYDGIIEIRGIVRDPGSKAKVAVFSRNATSDVVGACVGVRGVRVQAVTSELKGEKIDVIKYSEDPIQYIVNAITPAKPIKVIYDEEENAAIVVLSADQLSLAIGRGGQNVRLASKITGIKLDIMTEEDERKKRTADFKDATSSLVENLNVEEIIAQLLVSNGFTSVKSIADTNVEILSKIEGFNEDIASEIHDRALECVSEE
ncbi:MAG: transcription termination factor NusA [Rickettsiales bacterium]|jgi:N utilization substance protein A|nr:transcription termination factor NusA [Rickettsiales bacterium]